MLNASEIEMLFSALRAAYGHKFPHAADAVPIWLSALRDFDRGDLQAGVGAAVQSLSDYPPTLPEFVGLCRQSRQDGTNREELDEAVIYANCKPRSGANPKGNLLGITLNEAIARRRPGESVSRYRGRISDELIFAQYPLLRPSSRGVQSPEQALPTPADRAFDELHRKLAARMNRQ